MPAKPGQGRSAEVRKQRPPESYFVPQSKDPGNCALFNLDGLTRALLRYSNLLCVTRRRLDSSVTLSRMRKLFTFCLLVLSSAIPGFAQEKSTLQKPNIIMILSDDVGLGDVGYTGRVRRDSGCGFNEPDRRDTLRPRGGKSKLGLSLCRNRDLAISLLTFGLNLFSCWGAAAGHQRQDCRNDHRRQYGSARYEVRGTRYEANERM